MLVETVALGFQSARHHTGGTPGPAADADLTLFYLLMPIVLGQCRALALVREKEQRTLEPILATLIRDRDLLLAKLVAAVIPALLITWAAFVAGA